jgi:nicotinamide mononucleotide adenylyltransferase
MNKPKNLGLNNPELMITIKQGELIWLRQLASVTLDSLHQILLNDDTKKYHLELSNGSIIDLLKSQILAGSALDSVFGKIPTGDSIYENMVKVKQVEEKLKQNQEVKIVKEVKENKKNERFKLKSV